MWTSFCNLALYGGRQTAPETMPSGACLMRPLLTPNRAEQHRRHVSTRPNAFGPP